MKNKIPGKTKEGRSQFIELKTMLNAHTQLQMSI